MLRIYPVCIDMVREVSAVAHQIAVHDKDLARQLRRSSSSVPLNVAEGAGARDGRRRARYVDALGSAREAVATLEVAAAIGYIGEMDPGLRNRFDHIIGTLVKIVG